MRSTPLSLLASCALLAACGSAGTANDAQKSFVDAAPTYNGLAMDQTVSDTSPPSDVAGAALTMAPNGCHPHLFLRSHEVVNRVNRHLYKFLRHVEAVIQSNPTLADNTQHVWEKVRDGVDVKFTISRSGEVYSWTLELAPAGSTTFTTVFTGEIDRTGATGPHQGTGSLTLDLDALAQVIPTEHARGVIQVQFAVTASSRKIAVDAANVRWDVQDDMMDAAATTLLDQPRNDHYVYFREYGKGGSIKLTDQMVFFCPANMNLKLADVGLVDRWYKTGTGAVHGRSDAVLTGGQLPSHTPPIAKIVGVTCHQSANDNEFPGESFWLMKAEDANGATITGQDTAVQGNDSTTACDPALNPPNGTVPTLTDATNDFAFPAADVMASDDPYPFPGM